MDESRMRSIINQAEQGQQALNEGQQALDEAEDRAAEMAGADDVTITVSRDRTSVHLHFRNDD